jgi:hypothetical protein
MKVAGAGATGSGCCGGDGVAGAGVTGSGWCGVMAGGPSAGDSGSDGRLAGRRHQFRRHRVAHVLRVDEQGAG